MTNTRFHMADLLARHGLPPEARRFLPPGPNIEGRARDLAELIRRISNTPTITVATEYGRN